jgi:hypothetical protein
MKNKNFPIYEIGIFLGPLSAHFISTTRKKGGVLMDVLWKVEYVGHMDSTIAVLMDVLWKVESVGHMDSTIAVLMDVLWKVESVR